MELCDIPEDPWRIRLIRGHIGQDELFLKTTLMSITLISSKATLMGGIIDTGIDDDGSVANFVETEHIIEINKNLITFTTTRGSVPCFWDRINEKLNDLTNPYDIEIQREFEMHETAFKLHIKEIIESYH
jgi:synaptojanin